MPLNYPVGSSRDFEQLEPGSHIALCNMVVDLGLQPGSAMYPQPKQQVYIRFEVPGERITYEKDGVEVEGPITIGQTYTASMNAKATLRKHLESWRGRAFTDEEAGKFDVASILGKTCLLLVSSHTSQSTGKTRSVIAGMGKAPKGFTEVEAENPLLYYDKTSSLETFNRLPKWLQEKIGAQLVQESAKHSASQQPEQAGTGFEDDDIPF